MLESEIKINNNNNEQNEIFNPPDKTQAEKKFYEEKMKNITEDGIYQLVYSLCQSFCRGDEYKVNCYTESEKNNYGQKKHNDFKSEYKSKCDALKNNPNVFKAPDFSFPELPENNKNDSVIGILLAGLFPNRKNNVEPFIFFEMVDPNQFAEDVKNNSEAVVNYVKQFAYYLSQLLCDTQFIDFLISNDKNVEVLEKIITSGFVIKGDKSNPELFRNSNLLFVGSKLVNKYRLYVKPYDHETDDYKKTKEVKCKPLILNYLDKSFAISNCDLRVLLLDIDFYNIFAQTDRIDEIVINAIKKTDFHFTTYGFECDSISGLNGLLREREEKDLHDETKDCFWNKNRDQINNALADKCAEIFSNSDESVKINLDTLTEDYCSPYVCKFMSNYLSNEEQKNSEIGKNLIQALKKWLNNKDLLLWRSPFDSETLNKYVDNLNLFLRDDDLKKSFANACIRTIKHFIDTESKEYSWNLVRCQKELEYIRTKSKLFLDKFGITLENYDFSNEPYKTHGKNIAWLILWIFLFLVCIAAMTGIYIVMPILILKYICLLVFIPMFAIALKGMERIISIIDDRICNAELDIYKSKTKDEAKNKLYWDMSKIDEVKQCLNLRFSDVEKKNNEENDKN